MTRVFRGILLAAGILVATAGLANAQAIGSIFGKVTDPSGGVLPGVTVTVTRPGPAASVDRDHLGQRNVSVPQRADRHVYRDVRVERLQEGRPLERGHHDQLQRPDRSEDGDRAGVRRNDGHRRGARRRHQEDHHRRDVHQGHPREHPDGARPVADHQHDAGRAGRPQRRRLRVRPAGRSVRVRHRPNVQWNLEGGSITDLSSNSSPSYFNFDSFEQIQVTDGRRRRLRAVLGSLDQPGHQERQQRVQGHRGRDVRERRDADQQRDARAVLRRVERIALW